MYNTDLPNRAELPTSRQLLRSTFIALVSAVAILVTIVLPAEYAIDPTGVGKALGLVEMGAIKTQLAEEAARDRKQSDEKRAPSQPQSMLVRRVFAELFIGTAAAQAAPAGRSDKMSVTLKPGEGGEVKLPMRKGAKAKFSWTVAGGDVNYDLHGDGGGQSTSYQKGRGVSKHEGVIEAAFDGDHGWFWRNRGTSDVTITVQAAGDYAEMKKMK